MWGFAKVHLPDSATLISVFTLVVLLLGAPRYIRGSRTNALMLEKDKVIETKDQTIDSQLERLKTVDRQLKEALKEITQCHADASAWQARYEEQAKYTAEGALRELKEFIGHEFGERTRASEAMLAAITKFETAMRTNTTSTSELLIKNMEVMTRVDETLHRLLAKADPMSAERSRIE